MLVTQDWVSVQFCIHENVASFTTFLNLFILGAALYFHENNDTDFLILEAKDYIGGRVKGVDFAGVNLPLGAGWIHNIDQNNDIYKLALKYGLNTTKQDYSYNSMLLRY